MAKFLFTVWPFPGHVNPCIAIAHALGARSHEVAFYTGKSVQDVIQGEGFNYFSFHQLDEEKIYALARSEFFYFSSLWSQLRRTGQIQTKLRAWLLDTIPEQLADLETVLEEWRPDVLICDQWLWGPILVLHEIKRLPVAVLSCIPSCPLTGPEAPVWGRGLPRPRNGITRLRAKLGQKVTTWLSAEFQAGVNALRQRYRLPPLQVSATQFAGQMPLYLMLSAWEFDYARRDLPASVHYVGSCSWDKPSHAAAPPWLASLAGERPIIYVTEATLHMHEPFLLKAAARAFGDKPAQVIMTTGGRDPAALGLGTLASNIRLEPYAPHSELLPKVSVVVTMGGAGSVLGALTAGAPLVVVPTEWDKPENAQRVVAAGAGLRLEPKQCTPERLRAAVERVLTEPAFRRNAQRLAAIFANYDGPAQAAKLLERLAITATPQRRAAA